MKLDILAFGAHPDDVEMGCGGTIAKSTSNGKKVGIVDLTRGELGTNGTVEIREEEANVASKILGVSFRMNLELEDGFIFNNKDGNPTIAVIDEGTGFIEKDTNKIFNRFYSNRPKNFGEHSGLGLNIVKNLVELHNGQIKAENNVNKGAKVEIIFPATQ